MDKIGGYIYFFLVSALDFGFASYLPLNEEAYRWEIYCHDVGFTRVPPESPYPPFPEAHPHEFSDTVATGRVLHEFQLIYITEGRGRFWSGSCGEIDVVPGTVFMLFPGVEHRYQPLPEFGWFEQWIGFSGPHAQRLWDNGILQESNPVFEIGIHDDLVQAYDAALELCREQPPGFQVRLGALVLQIVASAHAHQRYAQQDGESAATIARARHIMRQSVESGTTVEDVAAHCNVTYNELLRSFRDYTGLTPYQYFLQMRIHRAKELLRDPGLQVKQVASRLNFDNQYYFARLFRQKVGMTPTEWRGSLRVR